jgi:plasmid maintenance system antidote protein VapI
VTAYSPTPDWTVTDFAKRIGVTRVALSRVVNGKAGISADLVIRLTAAPNLGAHAGKL